MEKQFRIFNYRKKVTPLSVTLSCIKVMLDKDARNQRLSLTERLKIIDDAKHPCELCGYDRCKSVLHFHHRDPSTKKFGITLAKSVALLSEVQLVDEIKKCVVVCSNCHGEIHNGLTKF
jgi:hypothetical protein